MQEICEGVKAYFNAMLGSQLLYKFERLQYAEVRKQMPAGSSHPGGVMLQVAGIAFILSNAAIS